VHSKSSAFWDKIFQQTESVRKERIFKPRLQLVKKILQDYGITNCKKMIEVGAGYGWFCEMAKEEKIAEEIIAIEPSPKVAQMCKQIGGIRVIESVIERCLDQLDADLMVSFEVVHLLFDPISFLQNCFAKLRNNGILIFSLTNYYGFDIQILQDKSDYITPTFLNLFNPESISKLLESIGYRNIKISTPGLMDLQIVINKSKSGQLDETNCPMGRFLTTCSADFIAELQSLLQKHNLSSHMVVSAQK
jgi:2-polyprenyl-3-methyl-5-hydroxy-6-metoxy-1,4-benzoquinol methylase